MWRKPIRWERQAEAERLRIGNCAYCAEREHDGCEHCGGPFVRPRVFCASLADVFEDWDGVCVDSRGRELFTGDGRRVWWDHHADDVPPCDLELVRLRLFSLIDSTPNLDWLLLTKRPENIRRMLPIKTGRRDAIKDGKANVEAWRRENVWLGVSIACQEDADRLVPELLKCRDLAAKLFLSIEPLIEPVMLHHWIDESGAFHHSCGVDVDWIIVGGESGPNARPCKVEWIRSIVKQCQAAGVPCFVKQLGANAHYHHGEPLGWPDRMRLRDPKGGDPSEWPEDLRVREVPT